MTSCIAVDRATYSASVIRHIKSLTLKNCRTLTFCVAFPPDAFRPHPFFSLIWRFRTCCCFTHLDNVSNLCPPSLSRERGYFEQHFHPVLGERMAADCSIGRDFIRKSTQIPTQLPKTRSLLPCCWRQLSMGCMTTWFLGSGTTCCLCVSTELLTVTHTTPGSGHWCMSKRMQLFVTFSPHWSGSTSVRHSVQLRCRQLIMKVVGQVSWLSIL